MKRICSLFLFVVLILTSVCCAQAEVSPYYAGRGAFNAGNYEDAAVWFEKCVEQEENQHALFYLYQIYNDPTFSGADEGKAQE